MPGVLRTELRPADRNMLGMKTLYLTIGLLVGAGIAFVYLPRVEVVEAAAYVPVPEVHATCDEWLVKDTSPDFYWDGADTEFQTSTADYWTAKTIRDGVQIQSESVGQGESITVEPSDDGNINVTWYDSDRSGRHEPLSRVVVAVGDC